MPTVFNAANERAVALFLKGKIGFTDIARLIKNAMDTVPVSADPDVDMIFEAEDAAIAAVDKMCEHLGEKN